MAVVRLEVAEKLSEGDGKIFLREIQHQAESDFPDQDADEAGLYFRNQR